MTPNELVKQLAIRTGRDPKDTEQTLQLMLELVAQALRKGEMVTLQDFGRFAVEREDGRTPEIVFFSDRKLREKLIAAEDLGYTSVTHTQAVQPVSSRAPLSVEAAKPDVPEELPVPAAAAAPAAVAAPAPVEPEPVPEPAAAPVAEAPAEMTAPATEALNEKPMRGGLVKVGDTEVFHIDAKGVHKEEKAPAAVVAVASPAPVEALPVPPAPAAPPEPEPEPVKAEASPEPPAKPAPEVPKPVQSGVGMVSKPGGSVIVSGPQAPLVQNPADAERKKIFDTGILSIKPSDVDEAESGVAARGWEVGYLRGAPAPEKDVPSQEDHKPASLTTAKGEPIIVPARNPAASSASGFLPSVSPPAPAQGPNRKASASVPVVLPSRFGSAANVPAAQIPKSGSGGGIPAAQPPRAGSAGGVPAAQPPKSASAGGVPAAKDARPGSTANVPAVRPISTVGPSPIKAKPEEAANDEPTQLSNFAKDVLGLAGDDMERGLGLDGKGNPIMKGRRLTFPVDIKLQNKNAISKRWRPLNGDDRRSLKELLLKNYFLGLGSVVRDRKTHAPLIVYDVAHVTEKDGERYSIRLLKVAGRAGNATEAVGTHTHAFVFEECDFEPEAFEVMMVIDEAVGPRAHVFDIGTFLHNDRRERAEICLVQEYEEFRIEKGH